MPHELFDGLPRSTKIQEILERKDKGDLKKIIVVNLSNGEDITIHIPNISQAATATLPNEETSNNAISQIKEKLKEITGIDINDQRLIHQGNVLKNDHDIPDFESEEEIVEESDEDDESGEFLIPCRIYLVDVSNKEKDEKNSDASSATSSSINEEENQHNISESMQCEKYNDSHSNDDKSIVSTGSQSTDNVCEKEKNEHSRIKGRQLVCNSINGKERKKAKNISDNQITSLKRSDEPTFDLAFELGQIGCSQYANDLMESGYNESGSFAQITEKDLLPFYQIHGKARKKILDLARKIRAEAMATTDDKDVSDICDVINRKKANQIFNTCTENSAIIRRWHNEDIGMFYFKSSEERVKEWMQKIRDNVSEKCIGSEGLVSRNDLKYILRDWIGDKYVREVMERGDKIIELHGIDSRAYWKNKVLAETEKVLADLDNQEMRRLSYKIKLNECETKEELVLKMTNDHKDMLRESSKYDMTELTKKTNHDPFQCRGFEPQHFDVRACKNCNNVQYAHTLITKKI